MESLGWSSTCRINSTRVCTIKVGMEGKENGWFYSDLKIRIFTKFHIKYTYCWLGTVFKQTLERKYHECFNDY